LGLEKNADAEAIRKAYKRRLQHLHPDRFETKGPEAKKAAQQAFLRVRQAYEVLTKEALPK
jgi:DnaJ-class molecular chaperone